MSNSGPGRSYAYYSNASSNYDGVLWPDEDVMFQVSPFSARGPVGRFTAKPVRFKVAEFPFNLGKKKGLICNEKDKYKNLYS